MHRIGFSEDESERKQVKGRRVNLGGPTEFNFFYYNGMSGYCICELESGFSLATDDTLKMAKNRAIKNLKNTTIKKFRQMIKKCIKKHGYANKPNKKGSTYEI